MSFSISFDKEAAKFLERLPKNISERIVEKFEQIKKMPKNLLSPQQAVGYSPQIFLPFQGNRHFQSFQIGRSKLRGIKPNLKIKENPFRYIEHYEGKYYKIRIGDFRALIDIDFQRKILFVRIFDKRRRVYK